MTTNPDSLILSLVGSLYELDNPNISFTRTGSRPLLSTESGVIYTYSQYYNGVPVEGGGVTAIIDRPRGPCEEISRFHTIRHLQPNIYTEFISNSTTPHLSADEAATIALEGTGSVVERNTLLYRTVSTTGSESDLRLLYRVQHQFAGELVASEVDALSGELLVRYPLANHIAAETQNYDIVELNDDEVGNERLLQTTPGSLSSSIGQIRIFDEIGSANCANAAPTGSIPTTSPSETVWPLSSNPTLSFHQKAMYQALYLGEQVHNAFSTELGQNLGIVDIGIGCTNLEARALSNSDLSGSIFFGNTQLINGAPGQTYAVLDIMIHEFSHIFVSNSFFSGNDTQSRAMHEGISDIITIYLSAILTGSIDWMLASDVTGFPAGVYRDPSNGSMEPCIDNVLTSADIYEYAEPLMVWFYDAVQVIRDIDEAKNVDDVDAQRSDLENLAIMTKIIVDATAALETTNRSYQAVSGITVALVEEFFGVCSEESIAIQQLWNDACLTPAFDAVCTGKIVGPGQVCADVNSFILCIETNFDADLESNVRLGFSEPDYQ